MDFDALLKRLKDSVLGLSRATQIAIGLAVAAIAALALLLSGTDAVRTDATLFSGLDATDAGEIVAKLKEQRVPYSLAANGTAIMVPEARVHELRLELAQGGLPKGGGVGLEIFDRPSYGQSDFVQQKNYLRALQGELERTIGSMDHIQKARVHLALPERRLFRDAADRASASVIVKLRQGRVLSEAQASAIVHLVSTSVAGLAADRVTLVDDSGAVLSNGAGRGDTGEHMDKKRRFERDTEEKIRATLDRVLGVGQSTAQVSVDLDFSQVERMEETYDPERPVLRSEQALEEEQRHAAPANAGVAGVRSNLGPADPQAATTTTQNGASSQKRSTTKNFEINKVTSRTVLEQGRLLRVSAAVLVDGTYEGGKFSPRPKEQLEALTAAVKQIVGFDDRRGDQLVLHCVPFDRSAQTPDAAENPVTPIEERAKRWAIPAAAALTVIIAMLALIFALRGRRQQAREMPALLGPRPIREVEAMTMTMTPAEAPPLDMKSVQQAVLTDANKAASVVRGWLAEGKKSSDA